MKDESIWFDTHQIARLFNGQRPAIVKHIQNIYKTKELQENATCSILEQVAPDGKKRKRNFYNLDMIISVGYRVNSKQATELFAQILPQTPAHDTALCHRAHAGGVATEVFAWEYLKKSQNTSCEA